MLPRISARAGLCLSIFLLLCGQLWSADSPFLTGNSYPTGKEPDAIAVGDFNGDGRLDIVVGNRKNNNIDIFLAKANGAFANAVTYRVAGAAVSVAVADVNGDGKLDLVVAGSNSTGGNIDVLLGNGDGTFQAAVAYALPQTLLSVVAVDLNGDGHPDVVTVTGPKSSGQGAWVLLNEGDGTFQVPTAPALSGPFVQVAAGDFNRDGKQDLLLGTESVLLALGNGDGTFQKPVSVASSSYYTFVVGDFNGDGKLDFAGTQPNFSNPDLAAVQLGNGDGTFQPAVTVSTGGYNGRAVLAVDLNGDGKLDLVSANLGSSNFSVMLGKGDGTLAPAVTYAAPLFPVALAAGDFNGNHKQSLATVGLENLLTVYPGNGDGTLQTARSYPLFGNFGPFTNQPAFADVNGDGLKDIIAPSDQGVAVYLNLGGGIFSNPVFYGGPTGTIALGDVNGDGKLDIVTLYDGAYVMLGNGDGTFQVPKLIYASTQLMNAVILADFNGDGKLDIAGLGDGSSTVTIMLGNGDGTFQTAVTYPTLNGNITQIHAADLNGDGKLDLYVTGLNDGPTKGQVLLGNGDGTFQAAMYSGDGGGNCAVIADFNGDGKLDIALASLGNSIQIAFGKGDGTFINPVNYPISGAARCIATGDFNGDGHPDLAVAADLDSVVVFSGKSDGTFIRSGTFYTGQSWGIGAADLNGDGLADLAIIDSNGSSGTLEVALSRPSNGPKKPSIAKKP